LGRGTLLEEKTNRVGGKEACGWGPPFSREEEEGLTSRTDLDATTLEEGSQGGKFGRRKEGVWKRKSERGKPGK